MLAIAAAQPFSRLKDEIICACRSSSHVHTNHSELDKFSSRTSTDFFGAVKPLSHLSLRRKCAFFFFFILNSSICAAISFKIADFERVIELLEAGTIDIEPWITHRVAFGNELLEAFPIWIEPQSKFIKAIVEV
jgi:threonine dehydrogenase-like Zn-dependent dehydrogenase